MKIQDVVNAGIQQSIRSVLTAMGPEKIDLGLTAFDDGKSSWDSCFFARAYPELQLHQGISSPDAILANHLGVSVIAIRVVYRTFDGRSAWMTQAELRKFVEAINDESRPSWVMDVINGVDYNKVESTEMVLACAGNISGY